MKSISDRVLSISYLVLDVDGTMTDGNIYIGSDGEIAKAFSVKDGYAISELLPRMGIEPLIVTGRSSEIVKRRCEELGVSNLYQGVSKKDAFLKTHLMPTFGIKFSDLAYMGDDMNDFAAMVEVKRGGGLIGCPCDAAPKVIGISDYTSTKVGGGGAVRDFVDWIATVRGLS